MTKTYKCRLSVLGVIVEVDGVMKHIEFKRNTINAAGIIGCIYVTDDEKEQKAIESLERFNSGFKNQIWLDQVEEEPVVDLEVEPAAEEKKVVRRKKK